MRLNLRDLKQVKWELEVQEDDTVAQIKSLNAQERGYGDEIAQKLIYSGRILKDNEKISTYEIDSEKGFIVCMTSKKKAPKPKAEPTTSAAEIAANAVPPHGPPPGPPPAQAQSEPRAAAPGAGAGLPAVSESTITSMIEMGYVRPLVLTALRMAYNNPDRAVEFLLNGQAQDLRSHASLFYEDGGAAGPDGAATAAGDAAAGDAASGEPGSESDLHDTTDVNLFDSAPQDAAPTAEMPDDIRQLRQLVRENPSIMEPLIEQLAEQNPMLAEAITQNLDEFLGDGEDLQGDEYPEGATTIEITPEENEAIGRLVELGFDRNLVIQAYFACDKNENLTANYLFEHGHED